MSELPSQENRLIQVSVLFKGEDPSGKKKFANEKLLLESFTGQEGISMPFHFDLVLRSVDPAIDFDKVVGQPATIRVVLPDNKFRFIDGIISTFTQLERTHELTTYQATLVPRLWILTRNYDCRIFQNRTVPQIIKAILKENGVLFVDDQLSSQGNDGKPLYPPREYCVQYNETDFDFISRLMEEEGIFYFFRHEETKHTLVLADNPLKFVANPLLPQKGSEPEAVYGKIAETEAFDSAITAWNVAQEVRPDIYELRDFNFKQPTLDLTFSAKTGDDKTLEIYEFPGEYDDKSRGQHLIDVKIEQIETTQKVISGGSRYAGLMPAFYFVLKNHFRSDFNNAKYVPTSIFHVAQQGGNYQATNKDAQCDFSYTNTFTCIPHPTKFRPPQTTQLPVISSTQTAIVVGHKEKPAKEEIYMDELGRVKVRFHWDRRKQNQPDPDDDPIGTCPGDCSCFIRVAQPWAGKEWGHQWIPRIGQEVVVTFIDGNPDRPLITGMVYNGDNPLPFKDHPSQSGIKTHSTPDGTGNNFNLIRFEDKKDHECLEIHAERTMIEGVEASQFITVGGSRHITTGGANKDGTTHGDVKELVYKNHNLHVKGDLRSKIEGKSSHHVIGNVSEAYDADASIEIGGKGLVEAKELHLQASQKIVMVCGSSSIVIDAGGVTIVGSPMIKLNCPGPPAVPLTPGPLDDPEDP